MFGFESAAAFGPVSDGKSGIRTVPRQDPRVRAAVTAAVIVVSALTVRPVGSTGRGLAVAALLVLCSVTLLIRHLSLTGLLPRIALLWLSVGLVAAALLLGVASSGSSYLFAYFLVGHAGYRLPLRQALLLAALSALLCTGIVYLRIGPGHALLPSIVELTTGLPVLAGILSRSRQSAVEAMAASAEAAGRAARAEAQALVLTERSRIARDVHDVLAHSLAAVNMHLELADALIDTGDLAKVREAHDKAHSMVKESLEQAQWAVHALREDSLPLRESLTAMVESSGHRDALTVTGTLRELPAQITQGLLRIAQEALTNAARHAPGGSVHVELVAAASTTLRVRNGPPRDAAGAGAGAGSGMGLIGMRERVTLLGGTLTAGPITEGRDQGGWQVEAVIPR